MAIANITASEQGNLSNLLQLYDGITKTPYKWLLLQDNLLDGSFHPIDSALQQQVGWQGSSLSDASGILSSHPMLTITLSSAMYLTGIRIIGDNKLSEYPSGIIVKVYNAGLELVHTSNIVGNTEVERLVDFGDSFQTSKIEIIITDINKPNATVKILEVSYISNINDLMDAPMRRVHGKVNITYTDPVIDDTTTATASSEQECAPASNTLLGIMAPAFKGFSLHDNKLDGTYYPLSSAAGSEVGWWSEALSDGSCVFTDNPLAGVYSAGAYGIAEYGVPSNASAVEIILEMSPRPFYELVVTGDVLLDSFPVDFDIMLYSAQGTLLHTESVVGNDVYNWSKSITTVSDVCKMRLVVYRINKPYEVLKIVNLYSTISETYDMDKVVSIGLLEELSYSTEGLSIGAISANEIDIALDNTDRAFSRDNPNSSIAPLLKKNRVVKAWLGVEINPDDIEWYEMGTFYTTSWKAPVSSTEATLTARDRLELLRGTDFKARQIYTNISLYSLFENVLLDAGIPSNEYIIDIGLQNIIIPYAWFPKCSHRDALARIAACGLISVFCDRRNRIIVDLITNQMPAPLCTLDNDVNVYDKDYPMAMADVVNSVEVLTYKIVRHDTLESIYNYSEMLVIPANTTRTVTIVFDKTACFDIANPVADISPGILVDSYIKYSWGMDIVFTNTTEADAMVNSISVTGKYLEAVKALSVVAEDAVSVNYDGKLQAKPIEHIFIQDYAYAKTLSEQALSRYLDAGNYVTLDCRGNVALSINDAVSVVNAFDESTRVYRVAKQDITWDGALSARIEGR